jgi:hypothetical protein
MPTKKVFFLIIPFSLFTITLLGQTNPPPMAMPTESNVILVDKIIEVTKHEKYFIDYCTDKVKSHSLKNKWSQEKTNQILESIKFKYYSSTIYNSYAFYSIEQLKTLLEALTFLNKKTKNNLEMILTNSMMQGNLDVFVEGVIEGKYVMTK